MSKVPDTGQDTIQFYFHTEGDEPSTCVPIQLSHVDSGHNIWSCGQVVVFGNEARLCHVCIPYAAVLTIASLHAGTPYDSPQTDGITLDAKVVT